MNTRPPVSDADANDTSAAMTPERWRAVEIVLRQALGLEPARREAFIANACAGDEELEREVASLLASYDRGDDEFLERPAAEAFGSVLVGQPLIERVTRALAGRYAIERELAHGGMATVFRAHDLRHDRPVAIKVLREELAAAVGAERFLEEIRVTASLQHPHILALFDSGSSDGLLWYVMPLVEGETLRARLAREGRLPVDTAVQFVWEMADALDYAHRHGVVHRDIKPENVLLQEGHALVADFGIALALESAGGDRLTRTGITIGTPQYMAPEQAAGEREIDARADVYALGAVLHEMLVGEPPLGTALPRAGVRAMNHESAPLPALATGRADVPPFIDAAVRRALAKLPDDRFPSVAAFAAAVMVPMPGRETRDGAMPNTPRDEVRSDVHEKTSRGRVVSARAAVYAVAVALVLGLVGGVMLARLPLFARGNSSTASSSTPLGDLIRPRPSTTTGGLTLSIVNRKGHEQRAIPANRPWTPRFSPDGRRLAYGAIGDGRGSSDIWVTDLDKGTTLRLTDDDADSNDPQWSADGSTVAYSAEAPGGKDLLMRRLDGGAARDLARRAGMQFASDWLRDGSALLVTDDAGGQAHDIMVQPADGTPARPYVATRAEETAARISPDGQWVAYMSNVSGQPEVYLDSYANPGRPSRVSSGNGGMDPVWRGDGRELYFWENGSLVAAELGDTWGKAPASVQSRTVLFRAPYHGAWNTMYDVSPDGKRFAIVLDR
jgi:serine/threonine protein kinase